MTVKGKQLNIPEVQAEPELLVVMHDEQEAH
jgi:hypothetical protein